MGLDELLASLLPEALTVLDRTNESLHHFSGAKIAAELIHLT